MSERGVGGRMVWLGLIAALCAGRAAAVDPRVEGPLGQLGEYRQAATATLLPGGKVLIAGGDNFALGTHASAELYDPTTGTFVATGSMHDQRSDATATLLPDGRVLVAGGNDGSTSLESAELYDPTSGTFAVTASLHGARSGATANLLPGGKVLIVGGSANFVPLSSAELYDPATGVFTLTGSLSVGRHSHVAVLLPNGKVLVAGGYNQGPLASAELYDPATGRFAPTGSLKTARHSAVATMIANGSGGRGSAYNHVLVAAGANGTDYLASAELYDPATGTFSSTGNLHVGRTGATATALPDGRVLVVDGFNDSVGVMTAPEVFDPARGLFHQDVDARSPMPRQAATATLLADGNVLVAGGSTTFALDTAELWLTLWGTPQTTVVAAGSLQQARSEHTATLLADGHVLVAGGINDGGTLAGAELFDPALNAFAATGPLHTARHLATATLLPDGRVLVAGGVAADGTALGSAELFDPASGAFATTGHLVVPRARASAALLADGRVLVAGGVDAGICTASAEIFDPATGSFTATGSMASCRGGATATMLASGTVLVVGGFDGDSYLATAERFDPATGLFSSAGSLPTPRAGHTSTLLASGQVLVVGGYDGSTLPVSGDLYDPVANRFTPTAVPLFAGVGDAAALATPRGEVAIIGGQRQNSGSFIPASTLITFFRPAEQDFWSLFLVPDPASVGPVQLQQGRYDATATRLLDDRILVVGGHSASAYLASAELLEPAVDYLPAAQPVFADTTPITLPLPGRLSFAGRGFRGSTRQAAGAIVGSESSQGDVRSSASNVPVGRLERLDNGQQIMLSPDPASAWTDTSWRSAQLPVLPAGHYRASIVSAGAPSLGRIVVVDPSAGARPCVRDARTACLRGGRFEVTVEWRTTTASGQAQVMEFGSQRAENDDSVFYWFFAPSNFEMGLKVLDGCGINGKFWVYVSGLTDQGWTVHVRDALTGATASFGNAAGQLSTTFADTSALDCP